MEKNILLEAAFDSFWNWLLGGAFMLIGVLTFFEPSLQSALNWPTLSSILPPIGWFLIALIVWLIGFVINVRKRLKQQENDSINKYLSGVGIVADKLENSPTVKAKGGRDAYAAGRDINFPPQIQDQEKAKQSEVFDITPNVVLNERWISVIVPNPTNQTIECYCVLRSTSLDGKINNLIKRHVSAHSERISWSGGNTEGKGEGVKIIDEEGTLNIVTPFYRGLGFEMAKGTRYLEHNMQYGVGTHKIGLDLMYKSVGDDNFQSKIFDVNFVCYIEKPGSMNDLSSDVIKSNVGATSLLSFSGNNKVDDNLCIRIIG